MQTIEAYPESCRNMVRTIAEELKTDYETAYNSMLLASVLSDLSPSDPSIAEIVLTKDIVCGSK